MQIKLGKLEKEYLDKLVERTGKTEAEIMNLAIFELFQMLSKEVEETKPAKKDEKAITTKEFQDRLEKFLKELDEKQKQEVHYHFETPPVIPQPMIPPYTPLRSIQAISSI